MRFAKLGEEVFLRSREISCEEFRLYAIIVFHTWNDSKICRMKITEMCEIYDLDKQNTYRRYKILRKDFTEEEFGELPEKLQSRLSLMKTPWVEKTPKGIRPLVGIKTVNYTPETDKETVNFTPFENSESVKITPDECKNHTSNEEESVNFTPSFIPYIEPLKIEPLKSTLSQQSERKSSNGHSKFTTEECFRYVQILIKQGANIPNPQAYALKVQESHESDIFIQSALYPEQSENELIYEVDQTEKLIAGLQILMEMRAEGEDWQDQKKWYSPEEWQWLESEMAHS